MNYACFVPSYDAAHLAAHPKQKVSAMKLLVTAEKIPEDAKLNHAFDLGVKYRTRKGDFNSSGECGHVKIARRRQQGADCSVDCDGGGFSGLAVDEQHVCAAAARTRTHLARRQAG